ncbi:hypothetical protein GCM10009556_100050 [Acrocarpospora pleiomorpha]|nr:SpoIIE family protein phosphatase [Acrocarpospora pleiomorpha]
MVEPIDTASPTASDTVSRLPNEITPNTSPRSPDGDLPDESERIPEDPVSEKSSAPEDDEIPLHVPANAEVSEGDEPRAAAADAEADFEALEFGPWGTFEDLREEPEGVEDWGTTPVPILVPEITVVWPQPYAPELAEAMASSGPDGIEPDRIVRELPALWHILTDAVHQVGFGCLTRESVRWGSGSWQLLPMPRHSLTGSVLKPDDLDVRLRRSGWLQDLQVIADTLVRAAVGRWPTNPIDAMALVDSTAGDIAPGLDAVVDLLLSRTLEPGDVHALLELHRVLARTDRNPMEFRSFRETMVGSGKASGSVADNEDLAWSMSTGTAQTCLALMDGITGDHDGSGRRAVLAAMAAVRSSWESGKLEPAATIAVADGEVCARASDGGATAIFAHLLHDGRGQLASVGDSAAWQLRPDDQIRPKRYQAWRLTPVHTEYAENLRVDPDATRGRSALTRHLGGAAHRPFTLRFGLTPGDLLVLVSDGAAVSEEPGQWFGNVLTELAGGRIQAGRPVGPGLAADLVIRAERLGGLDNATALVIETDWARPEAAVRADTEEDHR